MYSPSCKYIHLFILAHRAQLASLQQEEDHLQACRQLDWTVRVFAGEKSPMDALQGLICSS